MPSQNTAFSFWLVRQELLNKFREKKVDFAAHTNTEDGGAVFLNLLGRISPPLGLSALFRNCHEDCHS